MKKIFLMLLISFLFFLSGCNELLEEEIDTECHHEWVLMEGKKATCVDGFTSYYKCEKCGEEKDKVVIPKTYHDYIYKETREETKTSSKQIVYECSSCGEQKITYENSLNRSDEEMQNLNILLVGNSFTNYNSLVLCLENIINKEGLSASVKKCAYGSQYLYDYVEGDEGDHYKDLCSTLSKNSFDIVFLQDQSSNPAKNVENFCTNVRKLVSFFKEKNITPILYETWSYKGGYLGKGWNEEEMTMRLAASYQGIADELDIKVSKAGSAFYLFRKESDLNLNVSDNQHPSSIGTYLVALTHYATIYGRKVEEVNYTYNDYISDTSITFNDKSEKEKIDDETQRLLEIIVNETVFGSSIVQEKYKLNTLDYAETESDLISGFKKEYTLDLDPIDSLINKKEITYVVTSGSWEIKQLDNGTQGFINTSKKATLMFQEKFGEENSDSYHTLSFDVTLLSELENYTYARGVLLASNNPLLSYFDGSDALVIGRRCYASTPALQAMRVWDPKNYPIYQKTSLYTFDCGIELERIGSCFKTLNQAYHIDIVYNLAKQKYGIYVDGELNGVVTGSDLSSGPYIGLLSYDCDKMMHSNFMFDGVKLVFKEAQ